MLYDVLFDPALVELGARILLDWISRDRVEHPILTSHHLSRVDYGAVEGAWVRRHVHCHASRIGVVQKLRRVVCLSHFFSSAAEACRLQTGNEVLVMGEALARRHIRFRCL